MPRVHIAILTFNNRSMLSDLLADVERQSLKPDKVFVVDNGSFDGTDAVIRDSYAWVVYERFEENTGSSGGYHRLLELASNDSDFVWTLDDDVRLEPDALEQLLAGFDRLSRTSKIGAVRSTGNYHPESEPTRLEIVPWRGSLFPTSLIREIGLPRKDYFLYGEDLEYSLRMKKSEYVCYWIPSSKCNEARSSNKMHIRIFGRTFAVYASPFRHYYGFRNEINILLEYREIRKLIRTLYYAVKVLPSLMMWGGAEKNKMISAMVQGVADGLRGRLGRNPGYIP